MKVTTYLLICLIEECAELIQRVCKSLRFGLYETQPEQQLNNLERMRYEFNDIIAITELLHANNVELDQSDIAIDEKKAKVCKYLAYSESLGMVESED